MNIARISLLMAAATLGSAAMISAQQPSSGTSSGTQPPSGAQTSPGARTDMPGSGMANTGNANDTAGAMNDKHFLHEAAEGGMAEIQFGQLASQKGGSDDVKQFGQKMVTDHTQLNSDLKPFADAKGVSAPKKLSKKDQAELNKLNGLSGDAFDKEYVGMMVKDHEKDLKDFQTEANTTTDPQLKAAVQKGSEVIQQHLASIQEIAKNKGVTTAGVR